ncbi:hypothetical protein ACEPAG_3550 [Sanghuangporus baumii]
MRTYRFAQTTNEDAGRKLILTKSTPSAFGITFGLKRWRVDRHSNISVPRDAGISSQLWVPIFTWNSSVSRALSEQEIGGSEFYRGYLAAIQHVAPCIRELFSANVELVVRAQTLVTLHNQTTNDDLQRRIAEEQSSTHAIGGRSGFDIGLKLLTEAGCIMAEIGSQDGVLQVGNEPRLQAFMTCIDKYNKPIPNVFLSNVCSLMIGFKELVVKEEEEDPDAVNVVMAFLVAVQWQIPLLKDTIETVSSSLSSRRRNQVYTLEFCVWSFPPEKDYAQAAVDFFVNKHNPIRQLGNDAAHPIDIGMSFASINYLVEQVWISVENKTVLRQIAHEMEKIHDSYQDIELGYVRREEEEEPKKEKKGKGKGKKGKEKGDIIAVLLGDTKKRTPRVEPWAKEMFVPKRTVHREPRSQEYDSTPIKLSAGGSGEVVVEGKGKGKGKEKEKARPSTEVLGVNEGRKEKKRR